MSAKIAIVTGANGNLGTAVVKKFSAEGFHVIGTVRHKQPSKENNENKVEEAELDLLKEEECRKFVEEVIAKNETIDVAVLTAGGFTMGDIAATKTSDIAKQYQLNFETAYNIARPVFLQMMRQNNGRIFLIGSRQGLETAKGKSAIGYSLSKSLLFRLAEIMNAEAKGKNVEVSVIVPGTIDTPQNRESMPGADFSAWESPSEIAEVIYFYSGGEGRNLHEPVIKIYNKP
jgi:NAD(P)-dependent dehydrogenase (short-subunit alcohol dehydrogenase family)